MLLSNISLFGNNSSTDCPISAKFCTRKLFDFCCFSSRVNDFSDIGSESRYPPTPTAFDASVRGGGPRRNIAMPFGTEKLEWCGYPTVK